MLDQERPDVLLEELDAPRIGGAAAAGPAIASQTMNTSASRPQPPGMGW